MVVVPLKDLTYQSTNLLDDNTHQWSATASYEVDTIRQLDNMLYGSLDIIEQLCEYYHDNSDLLNPYYTKTVIDDVEVADNTAVTCLIDVTVVYNKDTNKYYIFDNSSGTTDLGGGYYSVDFTTQDPSSPPNFTEILNYRHKVYNPVYTPLKWENLGYTNKYKLLDKSLSSQTISDSTIDNGDMKMTFDVGKADNLFLFNIEATSVIVKIIHLDTDAIIFEETAELGGKSRGSFYGWWFYDYNYTKRVAFEFPLYLNVRIEITLKAFGNISKCGMVGVGVGEYLGATLYGMGGGIIDFSKKEVNSNGETFLEVGDFKATNSVTMDVLAGKTDDVVSRLVSLRATPVVFKGSAIYTSSYIYGIYNKWDFIVNLPTVTKITLDLESLI